MAKVMVVGAGSVGLYLAGAFAAGSQGNDSLSLLARKRVEDTLTSQGILVSDLDGKSITLTPSHLSLLDTNDLKSEENKKIAGEHNIFLVCVKSSDTESIAQILSSIPLKSSPTFVISCQNGMKNAETLRKFLPSDSFVVLSAVVGFNVIWDKIECIHRATSNPFIIEQPPSLPTPPPLAQLSLALKKGGCPTQLRGNIEAIKWGKLCLNLNNGINALSGKTLQKQFADEGYRDLLVLMLHEAVEVLKKNNIKLEGVMLSPQVLCYLLSIPQFLFFPLLPVVIKLDPAAKSSMQWDLSNGRKTEIGELQGKIIDLAEKKGVPTPVNKAIALSVREEEKKKEGCPNLTAEQIFATITDKTARRPLIKYKAAFYIALLLICGGLVLFWYSIMH